MKSLKNTPWLALIAIALIMMHMSKNGIEFFFHFINWSVIASILMAAFAYFSWRTAREQKKSQEFLLKEQNKISQKEYLLYKSERLFELSNLISTIIERISDVEKQLPNVPLAQASVMLRDLWIEFDFANSKTKLIFPKNIVLKTILGKISQEQEKIDLSIKNSKEYSGYENVFTGASKPLAALQYGVEREIIKAGEELNGLETKFKIKTNNKQG